MDVLFDYGAGGEPEWSPPAFKDCQKIEIEKAFLNPTEFANLRTVVYDGETYKDIPVVEIGPREDRRMSVTLTTSDHVQGLYKRHTMLYFNEKDLNGIKPERDTNISVSDTQNAAFFHQYKVVGSVTEMGMYKVTAEEMDE